LDTDFSVWDGFFFFWLVFYNSDNFFQTLEKLVLHDFFCILAFSDFLKTNFVICSTKNMGKYFVLSDKLLHVACDTWPSRDGVHPRPGICAATAAAACLRRRMRASPPRAARITGLTVLELHSRAWQALGFQFFATKLMPGV
jgi:hypothetical protein